MEGFGIKIGNILFLGEGLSVFLEAILRCLKKLPT